MLTLCNEAGEASWPLNDIPADSFFITHVYGGLDKLSFEIPISHPLYPNITEEAGVEYGDNHYLVKMIDERESLSTVDCTLDLDFLKSRFYTDYTSGSVTLADLLAMHLPDDWKASNAGISTSRRTITFDGANDYDIIMEASKVYGVCYRWNHKSKTVTIIKPENIQPSGEYITSELNLRSIGFLGDSSALVTRLYCRGKDGMTISSVNGGLEYVQNLEYTNKIICGFWEDERYTDPQSMKDDAIEKLKTSAFPVRSYECDVVDLAKLSPEYDFLEINLYKVVTLIDLTRKNRVDHRVVEYKEYPLNPVLNVVTLANVTQRIETTIQQVETTVEEEISVNKDKINQFIRDADTNYAKISETYTKGETNALIESQAQQTKDAIRFEVSEQYATQADLQRKTSELEVSIDGLSQKVSSRGGGNKLMGTAAYTLDAWTTTGTVTTDTGGEISNTTSTGNAFKILNGSLSQTVSTIPGGQYAYYFKYKLAGGSARLTVNNTTTDLTIDGWQELNGNFTAGGGTTTFALTVDNGYLYAADIILIEGKWVDAWQQAANEITTSDLTVDKYGIHVGASDSDIETNITHQAFKVINTLTGETVAFFDVKGSKFGETTVRKSLTITPGETDEKALTIIPQGDGHVFVAIND